MAIQFKRACISAAAFGLLLGNALAQVAPAASSAPTAPVNPSPVVPVATTDPDGYNLQGSTLAAPVSSAGAATPYEIRSNSVSGANLRGDYIFTSPVDARAAGLKTESGMVVYPSLGFDIGHNSNVRLSSAAGGSGFTSLTPEVVAEWKKRADRYTVKVGLNNTHYDNSNADSFTTAELRAGGDNYYTARARSGWSASYINGIDPVGSTNRAASAEPDKWNTVGLKGRFIYGAPEAQGRIEVDAGTQTKTYDNNRTVTAFGDNTLQSVAGRFFYRVGTRSLLLAEIRNDFGTYAASAARADNVERRYYLGYTWEASAATTGIVKLGQMTKDFGDGAKSRFEGSSWEASARWLPRSYSALDLKTSRTAADPTGLGNYTVNTGTDLTWNHRWNGFISTRAALGNLGVEYQGAGANRTDNLNNYSLAVEYQMRRWLKLGFSHAVSDRSSNAAGAGYSRNVSMFTLDASL